MLISDPTVKSLSLFYLLIYTKSSQKLHALCGFYVIPYRFVLTYPMLMQKNSLAKTEIIMGVKRAELQVSA